MSIIREVTFSADVQEPLPNGVDSVYEQDVDFTNSDFSDWAGDETQLFRSPFSTSISNGTADNPKQIVVAFERTTKAMQIGLGENNGGDFSNVKISLLGSGGATRSIYDDSANNTKLTSLNAEFEAELFNSLLIEFYTSDPVALSNITIRKASYVTSQIQGVDENGDLQTARVSKGGYLITDDFMLEIAKGNIQGHAVYRKFGVIRSIQATQPADVWEYGENVGAEIYTFSTGADIDSISSDNAGDTQEITIIMLDANYEEFTQTVTLNGQNRVAITPGLRLNRAYNSNGVPTSGNVYIYENTALSGGAPIDVTKVRGYISVAGQQTLQAVYTTPAGKTAYIYEFQTSMGGRKTGFATYEGFLRVPGGVFRIQDTHDLAATGTSNLANVYTAPRAYPEKTDFRPQITVDTNGLGFSCSFVVVLVDDDA